MLDLSKLTEFNHALIYGFEPESGPKRLAGSETFEDALFPEAGQHKDILDAYLYAQEIILPQIKKIGLSNITPEILIKWLKTIHGFIGKSLLQANNVKSGEYTNRIVLRWHQGSQLSSHFIFYFAGLHEQKTAKSFANFLSSKFDLDYKSVMDFISLSIKISNKYEVHESLKPFLEHSHPAIKGMIVLNKLASAHNTGLLSNEEKATINKIVKICKLPPDIPAAMDQWAQDTVKRLKILNAADLTTVANFLAITFYELTEIHPFPNANGRAASCLNNIFLRALGHPSIVLRHPGERENKHSLYQKAFAEIDSSLDPLKKLISLRILEANTQTAEDKQLKQIITLRVALSDLLQETIAKYPHFNILLFQNRFVSSPEILSIGRIADANEATILLLTLGISKLSEEVEQLKLIKKQNSNLFTNANLDNNLIMNICENLEKVSGHSGWKYNSKRGIAWLEIFNIGEANGVASELKALNIGKISVAPRTDNQIPVIKCENIDYKKLNSILLEKSMPAKEKPAVNKI